jgi:cytochrome b561
MSLRRKSLEERIADRQAQRPPLKEGKQFEHGPAKFVFIFLIVFVVALHLVGLIVLMALDLA